MVLVREIVNYIRTHSSDEIGAYWDNLREAVRRPSVDFENDLVYTPGFFDTSKAKLYVEVKGVKFIKDRQDAMWRPEDENLVFGVGCFVDSTEFVKLGCHVENRNDKAECLSVTLKAISDLLDAKFKLEKAYCSKYDDRPFYLYNDFEALRNHMSDIRYSGYYFEGGRWHVRKEGDDTPGRHIVGPGICAMCLLTGCDEATAREQFFVKISEANYERMCEIIRGVGGKEMVSSFYKSARRTYVARSVYLLIQVCVANSIRNWLRQSQAEDAMTIADDFIRKVTAAERKWQRQISEDDILVSFNF